MNKPFILFCVLTLLLYARPAWERFSSSTQKAPRFADYSSERINPDEPPVMVETFISRDMGLGIVHAAAICEMNDGTLAAVWYGGIREGGRDTAIYMSTHGPNTASSWSKPQVVADTSSTKKELKRFIRKIGNPVIFADAGNRLWLVYVTVSVGGWAGSSLNWKVSTDGGKSWTAARRLTLSPFINTSELVRNRPIPLSDGGFMIPIYHEALGKFPEILWFRPDAEGKTLSYHKTRMSGGRSYIQPTVVPYDERSAVAFYRNCSGDRRVGRSVTSDAGRTWSRPKPLRVPNPDAALSALALSDGRILLALNDSVKYRSNLRLLVSEKGSKSWERAATLEYEDGMEFSYPYMCRARNGRIHMVYTWRNGHIRHLEFNKAWLDARMAAYQTLPEKSRDLVVEIFRVFKENAVDEARILAESFRHSALGLTAALAEAEMRQIYRYALKAFYEARGHLARLDACLATAEDLGFLNTETIERLAGSLDAVTKELDGVIKDYEWYARGH
ncbi:MAG: four helix bundle protein [Deltaproteobacteria bacterium]|nr:four helix bundle protein [Deltaproteobacteria bacterium]